MGRPCHLSERITQSLHSFGAKSRQNIRICAAIANRLNTRMDRSLHNSGKLILRLGLPLDTAMSRAILAITPKRLLTPGDVLGRSLGWKRTDNAMAFDDIKRSGRVVRLSLELRSDKWIITHDVFSGLTIQAQRADPREAWIATTTLTPGFAAAVSTAIILRLQ